jgi:hypothetical protein
MRQCVRATRLFPLIALLIILGLPQSAKAQTAASGVVCDTPDLMRRFVLAEDASSALAVVTTGMGHF